MAVVEIWQRQEIPQGRVVVPRGENSLAEQFGRGLQELGQAGQQAANDIVRANRIIEQKDAAAWTGKQKPQAIIDLDKSLSELQDNAPLGASGHVDAVTKKIDEYTANLTKSAPNPTAQAEITEYMGALKARYLGQATTFQKSSELGLRVSNIDTAGDLWGSLLVSGKADLDAARAEMAKVIEAQGLTADQTASELRRVDQNLTTVAMNGQAASNPQQFLVDLEAGKWNGVDPEKLSLATGKAEALLQLQNTQAEVVRANHAIGLQTKVAQAVDLYKGGVDFAGFTALAGELKAAGQTELLQTLTNWKSDGDYARSVQTLPPAALEAAHDRNLKLAESTADPIQADMYWRHAEIDSATFELITDELTKDALAVAVRAKVAAPTDILTPLLNGNGDKFLEAARERQTARVQTQHAYGVTPKFFTPAELQRVMTTYNGLATAEQRTAFIGRLAELPENLAVGLVNELKQVAGGDQIPMYLSFLSEDRALGHDIIAGADLLKLYPKMLPDDSALEGEIDNRFGNLLSESPDQQLAMRQATENLYAALVHSKRGAHTGFLDINLLNQAFARVTGGAFLYDNGNNQPQVIIPPQPGMTEAQFEKLILAIDENLLIGQSARSAPGPGPGRRGPVFGNGRPVTARSIQEDGNFISLGRGRYRVLINGQPVRDGQTGALFVLDMNPLLRKAGSE